MIANNSDQIYIRALQIDIEEIKSNDRLLNVK